MKNMHTRVKSTHPPTLRRGASKERIHGRLPVGYVAVEGTAGARDGLRGTHNLFGGAVYSFTQHVFAQDVKV